MANNKRNNYAKIIVVCLKYNKQKSNLEVNSSDRIKLIFQINWIDLVVKPEIQYGVLELI